MAAERRYGDRPEVIPDETRDLLRFAQGVRIADLSFARDETPV